MSQLPPRIPVQSSAKPNHIVNPTSLKGKTSSHGSSFFDNNFSWVGELLDERRTFTNATPLRRVSDPVGIGQETSIFDFSLITVDDAVSCKTDAYCETQSFGDNDELECGGLYGPNSPRKANNLNQSGSTVLSAFFENIDHNPFCYLPINNPSTCDVGEPSVKGNCIPSTNFCPDQPSRRHDGQRSRVRKLQYIAELERTVNLFQTMEVDLAAKVASLFQKRATLSLENSEIKQKLANLRKEKMIKDGQNQSLKNELRKLNTCFNHHDKCSSPSRFPVETTVGKNSSEVNWQMLDMGKLSLGENPIPPRRHGL